MANLSNINGKFVVEQTTGYVGVGTTDPNYPIEVLNASAEIALNASGASIYRLRSDSTDSFRINKNGVGDRLIIDGSGNSTFAGTITSGTLSVGTSGTSRFTDTNAYPLQLNRGLAVDVVGAAGTIFGLGAYSTGTTYIDAVRIVGVLEANGTDGDMLLQVLNSGTHATALTLNNDTNATFAGNITGVGATFVGTAVSGAALVTIENNSGSTATSYGLLVKGGGNSSSGKTFEVRDDSGNTDLIVKGNGNVGIGTTSPNAPLQIASTNKTINGTLSGSNLSVYTTDTQAANVGASIGLGGMSTTPAGFEFYGTMAGRKENSTNLDSSGYLAFYTQRVAVGHVERMRIDSLGNVGIGTISPGTFLQLGTYAVAGKYINQATYPDIPSEHMMHITAPSTNAYYGGGISFGETAFTAANIVVRDAGGSGALDLCFGTGTASGVTEKMRIANNGNVGIGTTSPQTKLDVHGPTGTRNRSTTGNSSVFETSLYWGANGNTTTNVSIDTATVFPPMGSSGFILVEVSASGYGNSGSNGLIFSYITGGYGGHYAAVNQPYHPVTIITNTMMAGTCTWYNPSSGIIGITVTTTNSQGITGVMRVKVTTSY